MAPVSEFGPSWPAALGVEDAVSPAFLAGHDARAYSRYHHWWATLPGGEVRILPR
jgi:hypothetical protein